MPGSAFVGIAATDTFTHGWDLAKATGQSTDLAPQLAAGLLAGAKQFISDAIRGPEPMPFAAEQPAPPGNERRSARGVPRPERLNARPRKSQDEGTDRPVRAPIE